ncbi:hypothetical protein, unlikely [Trypanosoma congolense IL3000]|uniref:Uncharacterized protein n=1 Tax=Trypanosoma congolense (strain IL3000) TaxID=1068625 RepID=F9WI17_TRYCI|nr:hypothetical protein, unlikely [Trypanosoma congolense IL3000]
MFVCGAKRRLVSRVLLSRALRHFRHSYDHNPSGLPPPPYAPRPQAKCPRLTAFCSDILPLHAHGADHVFCTSLGTTRAFEPFAIIRLSTPTISVRSQNRGALLHLCDRQVTSLDALVAHAASAFLTTDMESSSENVDK